VMATRSGSIDPGLLLWLEEHEGLSPRQVADTLEHRSGLLGLAGTADMRELLARVDDDACQAVDIYLHRLASAIAAMTVSLGGLDVLVFTGGIGENSPEIRERTCSRLRHLGVVIDETANRLVSADRDVGAAGANVAVCVIAAHEDLEIARATEDLLRE
jgi:acetate kinase